MVPPWGPSPEKMVVLDPPADGLLLEPHAASTIDTKIKTTTTPSGRMRGPRLTAPPRNRFADAARAAPNPSPDGTIRVYRREFVSAEAKREQERRECEDQRHDHGKTVEIALDNRRSGQGTARGTAEHVGQPAAPTGVQEDEDD